MKFHIRQVIIPVLVVLCFSCSPSENQQDSADNFSGSLTNDEIENGRLTPEVLWKFGRLSDHRLSPDGQMLVYNLTRYDYKTNGKNSRVYIQSSDGGDPQAITSESFSAFNPRWRPDGTMIGYLSDETGDFQLWEAPVNGVKKLQITDIEGGIDGFEYSPDGSGILYLKEIKVDPTVSEMYPDLPLANVRIIDNLMYRHWNSWSDQSYSHIFIAPYGEGMITAGRDIMEGEPWDAPLSPYFDQAEISWGPEGKFIAYTCKKLEGKEYALSTNSDIFLYNIEDESTENITEGMSGYDKYPVFSPDGRMLAWQSMETPGYEADKERLFVLDLESREKEYLTSDFDQNAAHFVWSEDQRNIFFISGVEATYQIFKIDVTTREIEQITSGPHNYNSFSAGQDFLIGEKMSMSMATELFRVNPETGEEHQLSYVNRSIYEHVQMGRVEERWIKTSDGKNMLVWVIYPPDFDPEKKYPALLYCQGGPQSAVSQFFSYRWNFQLMAAHNYIVVAPNRRGLPTFGTEWNEQISEDYGGQNIKDYLSAIDALKSETYIDDERLGAVGASYGGYSVFYLAGHHQGRFNAFISHCGIYNFESMYAATEEMFFVNHDLGGAYWEKPKPESYQFSPHLYVDNWDTPIMIITGEYDFRIPYTESLQAFNAAQLRGVESRLLVFPDETHFVLKPQNSILWQREFFGWLDSYLK